ncbi:MAG: hypothetical protein Q7U54_16195 [Bacteroidales bacterium]|nr:hypothetical protein [Bacteroidales bacterium]
MDNEKKNTPLTLADLEAHEERKAFKEMERFVQIEIFDRKMAQLREQEKKQKPVEEPKQFKEYFAEGYQETLPEALKIAFAKDKKTTKVLLIHALQKEFLNKKKDENKPLLLLEGAFDSVFYDSMKAYFGWPETATYVYYMAILEDPEGTKAEAKREDTMKLNGLYRERKGTLDNKKVWQVYQITERIKTILERIDI